MHLIVILNTVFAEFERAISATYRYESLRYTHTGRDRLIPADISRRIFEEFYAHQGKAEHAAPTSGRRRSLHLRFSL